MADLIVKNLEDDVRDRLEDLARGHGHSLDEEVRDILRSAAHLGGRATAPNGVGSGIVALFSGDGIGLTQQEAESMELRGHPVKPMTFER